MEWSLFSPLLSSAGWVVCSLARGYVLNMVQGISSRVPLLSRKSQTGYVHREMWLSIQLSTSEWVHARPSRRVLCLSFIMDFN